MGFSLGRTHITIKTRSVCRWRWVFDWACVWGTSAWWCWWTSNHDAALKAGDLHHIPPSLWSAAMKGLSMGSSRSATTRWSLRNCKHLRTRRFFISFGSPQEPSIGKSQADSCSSSRPSSSGLTAQNRRALPANSPRSRHWSSLDLDGVSSSCCAGTPCLWQYRTRFRSVQREWTSSSFCGAGRKDCRFRGIRW